MKAELISREEIKDDDEITIWTIKDGESEICLNNLFDSNIYDCDWLDDEHTFCIVNYSEWESTELTAIVRVSGEIIKMGLNSIEHFIEKEALFIVIISGFGVGDESAYYMMDDTDSKWAVLNSWGGYLISPEYDSIEFDEEEQIFYADDYKFNISGESIT